MTKTFVITGATSGIGADAAKVFAAQGHNVVLAGRRKDKGEALAKSITAAGAGKAVFIQTDVTKDAEVAALIAGAEKAFGGVDVFFANSGVAGSQGPLNAASDYDFIFGVNVAGVVTSLRHAVPALERRGGGHFIVTSSIVSAIPMPNMALYGASKAAVDSLVKSAAAELAEKKIVVSSINPYVFHSEMSESLSGGDPEVFAKQMNPSGKAGRGTDLAAFLLELVEGKHSNTFPSGSNIAIDFGNDVYPVLEVPAKLAAKASA